MGYPALSCFALDSHEHMTAGIIATRENCRALVSVSEVDAMAKMEIGVTANTTIATVNSRHIPFIDRSTRAQRKNGGAKMR